MPMEKDHRRIYKKFDELQEQIDRQKKLYLKLELFLKDLSHKQDIHKKTVGLHNQEG